MAYNYTHRHRLNHRLKLPIGLIISTVCCNYTPQKLKGCFNPSFNDQIEV